MVLVREDDPEHHVDDAEDDGQLHLERVQEHDLVLGDLEGMIIFFVTQFPRQFLKSK